MKLCIYPTDRFYGKEGYLGTFIIKSDAACWHKKRDANSAWKEKEYISVIDYKMTIGFTSLN